MQTNRLLTDDMPGLAGPALARQSEAALAREEALFEQGLRADSNLELDWLWLFMQLNDPERRRYCLERALLINPQSAVALRELGYIERREPRGPGELATLGPRLLGQ